MDNKPNWKIRVVSLLSNEGILFLFEGVKRGLHFVQQQRQYHVFFLIKLCRVQLLLQFLDRDEGKRQGKLFLPGAVLPLLHPPQWTAWTGETLVV